MELSRFSQLTGGASPRSRFTVSFSLKRAFASSTPPSKRVLALFAPKHHGRRKKCAIQYRAIIVGQVHQAGFDHKPAELDQTARTLAALHNPLARMLAGALRFKSTASSLTAAKCQSICRQKCQQFCVASPERTPRRACASPP